MTTNGERECALVTGASAGIGMEFARLLAADGRDVVLLARSRDKLRALADELSAAHGINASIVPADLGEPDAAQAVFEAVRDSGRRIDILINNAGLLVEGPFDAIDLGKQLQLLQVNVVAMTALTYLFLAPMRQRGRGRIMNVASVASFLPVPNLAVYAASKAYVRSFSDALGQELSGTGVTVTALCPGVTDTGMVQGTTLGSMPSMMIMDPKAVAAEGYRACMAGTPIHVPGIANELAVQWIKYQPSWLLRAASRFMRKPQDK